MMRSRSRQADTRAQSSDRFGLRTSTKPNVPVEMGKRHLWSDVGSKKNGTE